mmetsp:Transcript_52079/g.101983  ORF Transcript_52079/g.101983 Transcript_52079/m.101983 type:complete len:205 (+) Transcript_52079:301-915(+)
MSGTRTDSRHSLEAIGTFSHHSETRTPVQQSDCGQVSNNATPGVRLAECQCSHRGNILGLVAKARFCCVGRTSMVWPEPTGTETENGDREDREALVFPPLPLRSLPASSRARPRGPTLLSLICNGEKSTAEIGINRVWLQMVEWKGSRLPQALQIQINGPLWKSFHPPFCRTRSPSPLFLTNLLQTQDIGNHCVCIVIPKPGTV